MIRNNGGKAASAYLTYPNKLRKEVRKREVSNFLETISKKFLKTGANRQR
jgi:hypothetical protein